MTLLDGCPNLAKCPNIPLLTYMMRNARFGPLTLLMTLRVIDVKSDDKFTRLFYVSIHDTYIRF